ncbi:PREDICTED: uncharacterized protein LOC107354746 [Acropora digitifera]|uniref:uncharacterized protein LOC107354746 n=1 Tax=Acropora digitifera TaxID=70779 RepID=UPI00077AD09A|nr:PREDICTED: uncharacterized protein LOC107354746 [Acropora digitifera]
MGSIFVFITHDYTMIFEAVMLLLLLLVLLAIFKLARVSTGSLSTAQSAAKMLLESFTSEEITETDLTAAEELGRGFTFDKYEEKFVTQVSERIKLTDFATLVRRISTRNSIPDKIQDEILIGQCCGVNERRIREFKFQKGETGSFIYCRAATVKREDSTIDLAFVFFHLQFKLPPRRIEEQHSRTILGLIPIGSRTDVRFEERNLSEKEQELITIFFRAKALKGFKQEYPALANERTEL